MNAGYLITRSAHYFPNRMAFVIDGRAITYFLIDRKHDKIITGGLNVYPREVEEILAAHPGVAQGVVFGADDPYWGEIISAAAVPRKGLSLTAEKLMNFSKEHLASYKRPRKIFFVEELPKNTYGKILRKELKRNLEGK